MRLGELLKGFEPLPRIEASSMPYAEQTLSREERWRLNADNLAAKLMLDCNKDSRKFTRRKNELYFLLNKMNDHGVTIPNTMVHYLLSEWTVKKLEEIGY